MDLYDHSISQEKPWELNQAQRLVFYFQKQSPGGVL